MQITVTLLLLHLVHIKKSDDVDYLYTLQDDKVSLITYLGSGGDVTVPEEIDGYVVAYNTTNEVFSENQFRNSLGKLNSEFDYVTAIAFPSMWDCYGNISLSDTPKLSEITITNTEYNFDDEVSENKPFGYSYVLMMMVWLLNLSKMMTLL